MLLSCDPGISNFGIAVIDPSNDYRIIETCLIKNIRKFTDSEKEVELIYGSRTVKVLAVISKFEELITRYPDVDTIVVEAPFYNALTPMAFSSLIEVISAIKYQIAIKYNLKFKAIEPLLVKKLFTNKGMASKEAMKQFLKLKKEEKSVIINLDIDTLSEHEIDAVAVGFSYYVTIKEPVQS